MRRNPVKLMVVGMLVLALMTGCGSSDNDANDDNANNHNANEGSNSFIFMDMGDVGHNAGEQESQTDTGSGQTEESNQSQSQNAEAIENTEGIEEELAAYRAEREKGVSSSGGYTMVQAPNEENYNYGVGDSGHSTVFDSRELNEAYRAADAYIKNTLNLESEAWTCVDPRMNAIYEDEDKGVASGYDADNIFVCEYNDNGNWQYLILVREGKGSGWEVLYHGSSYKID